MRRISCNAQRQHLLSPLFPLYAGVTGIKAELGNFLTKIRKRLETCELFTQRSSPAFLHTGTKTLQAGTTNSCWKHSFFHKSQMPQWTLEIPVLFTSKCCPNNRAWAYFSDFPSTSFTELQPPNWPDFLNDSTRSLTQFLNLSGYFVQDAADIILTGHARGSWEFLLHHVLVRLPLSCFYLMILGLGFAADWMFVCAKVQRNKWKKTFVRNNWPLVAFKAWNNSWAYQSLTMNSQNCQAESAANNGREQKWPFWLSKLNKQCDTTQLANKAHDFNLYYPLRWMCFPETFFFFHQAEYT